MQKTRIYDATAVIECVCVLVCGEGVGVRLRHLFPNKQLPSEELNAQMETTLGGDKGECRESLGFPRLYGGDKEARSQKG